MNYALAPFRPEDAEFLEKLFFEVRAPEFATLGLPEPALSQLLAMQFKAQTSGYAAQFPAAEDSIIWVGTERAGRVLVDRSTEAIQLVDIALLNRFRNHGIGTRLLKLLRDEATKGDIPLRLSVRFGNPAEGLYVRSGFFRTGGDGMNVSMEFRPGYTPEPTAVPEPPPAPAEAVEAGLTLSYFRTLVGKTVEAQGGNGTQIELVLEVAEPLRASERGAPTSLGDSFRLEFRGPLAPVLPGDQASIKVPGEEPLAFFLSPFAQEARAVMYEAIFNRTTPL